MLYICRFKDNIGFLVKFIVKPCSHWTLLGLKYRDFSVE